MAASPRQYFENADLLFNEQQIQKAIQLLATSINAECKDDFPIVLTVMNGGLVFAGQLIPSLNFPLELDYIHATRYQGATEGKQIKWLSKPSLDISHRNILILDDILDKGLTLAAIVDYCLSNGARQVKVAVMLEKELSEKKPLHADYIGFKVPDHYIFGYGMDIHGLWRNLPAIYALELT